MNFQLFSIIATIICINTHTECNAQRTKDKMYEQINGLSACFRRMNGTHQTGCSSDREGSTGVVHYVATNSDLEAILKVDNGLNYIPVIPIGMFRVDTVHRLESHGGISGLVVYKKNDTERPPQGYTHEDECPNRLSNMQGTCMKTWNEGGSGMLLEDIRFPIFYLDDDEEIAKIEDCFWSFNNHSFETHPERSVCSLELDSFMFASKDTPTCIRRSNSIFNLNPIRFCDPMGDANIWSSLFPIGRSPEEPVELVNKTMKHIIVATRLDTTSMFHELVPGAINPITGIVTLLATAQLLKRMLPEYGDYDKNVLFLMFHGESYDYIGSQRFLYDMQNGLFPDNRTEKEEAIRSIKLEDVALFVEISQLSNVTENIYVHTLKDAQQRDFVTKLKKHGKNLKISDEATGILPPASLQTFLKANPNLPGLVLSDHKDTYANRFYNSIYDNASNIIQYKYTRSATREEFVLPAGSIQEHIARVADMLALSLYEEIKGQEYQEALEADGYLIDELFHCHLENANCKIHQAIQRREYKEHPFSLYVGIADNKNLLTSLMGLTLFWFTARDIGVKECNKSLTIGPTQVYKHYVMSEDIDNLNETKCFRASMNFTEARSPAFLIEDYDWKSGEYSTWSESVWKNFSVRLFLKPARAHEVMTIAIGCVTFATSVALIYFLNSKSRLLFESETM